MARSGFKPFDTLIVILKEFIEKVNFEKNQRMQGKLLSMQIVKAQLGTIETEIRFNRSCDLAADKQFT